MTATAENVVRERFLQICYSELKIEPTEEMEILWNEIHALYSEDHRYYHTLEHIKDLLELSMRFRKFIQDKIAVDLAIIFHDVIYDPKSNSNEEDSAAFFEERLSSFLEPSLKQKVSEYIILTKNHSVGESSDGDLKLFIDFDMHILSVERSKYRAYAIQIRNEYIHVEMSDYCRERPKFLRVAAESASSIYASESFLKSDYDARAKENLSWECSILESGLLIEES
jgi:predicted metal-dependent HD superfamily phosphohydrolase